MALDPSLRFLFAIPELAPRRAALDALRPGLVARAEAAVAGAGITRWPLDELGWLLAAFPLEDADALVARTGKAGAARVLQQLRPWLTAGTTQESLLARLGRGPLTPTLAADAVAAYVAVDDAAPHGLTWWEIATWTLQAYLRATPAERAGLPDLTAPLIEMCHRLATTPGFAAELLDGYATGDPAVLDALIAAAGPVGPELLTALWDAAPSGEPSIAVQRFTYAPAAKRALRDRITEGLEELRQAGWVVTLTATAVALCDVAVSHGWVPLAEVLELVGGAEFETPDRDTSHDALLATLDTVATPALRDALAARMVTPGARYLLTPAHARAWYQRVGVGVVVNCSHEALDWVAARVPLGELATVVGTLDHDQLHSLVAAGTTPRRAAGLTRLVAAEGTGLVPRLLAGSLSETLLVPVAATAAAGLGTDPVAWASFTRLGRQFPGTLAALLATIAATQRD